MEKLLLFCDKEILVSIIRQILAKDEKTIESIEFLSSLDSETLKILKFTVVKPPIQDVDLASLIHKAEKKKLEKQ